MTRLILITAMLAGLTGCAGTRGVVRQDAAARRTRANNRAVAYYVDGLFKDMNQNPGAALLSYQEALLYDSTAADIHLAIGRDYLMLGKEDLARRALQSALRLDPESIESWAFLSEIEIRQNRITEAESALQAILKLDANNLEALNRLAFVALKKNEVERALKLTQDVLAMNAKPMTPLMMGLGDHFLEHGPLQTGLDLFGRLTEIDPWDGLGYFGLGMFREVAGDTTAAIDQYRHALSVMPVFPEAVARLTQIYMAQKEWETGLKLLGDAVTVDSTDIDAWLGMAAIHRAKGDLPVSVALLNQVGRRFPQDARPHFDLGQFYMQNEDYLEAAHAFETVTRLLPDNPGAWLNAGLAYLFADSVAVSERFLREAVQRVPNHFQTRFYLGTALSQLNRNDEARVHLEEALALDPQGNTRVLVMSTLASVYDGLGQFARADTLFEQSLRLDPDNGTVLNNYGYSLCVRGERLDEARAMAEKALSLEPDSPSFLDTLGWILFNLGDTEGALKSIQRSWDIRPESAEVADHLAEIHRALGDHTAARRLWQKALELEPDNLEIKAKLE